MSDMRPTNPHSPGSSGWDENQLADITPEQLAEMSNEDLNALIAKAGVGSDYAKYFSAFDTDKIDRIQDVMRGRMGELTSANRNNLSKLTQEGAATASMRGFEGAGDIKQRMEAQRAELFGATQAGRQSAFNQAQEQKQSAYAQYESEFAADIVSAETAADADKDDKKSCFHGNSIVTLKNGITKKVKDVEYGDMIQAFNNSGDVIYSKVVKDMFFNTKDSKNKYYYTIIKAGDSKLKVTARHRIFVNGIKKTKKARYIHPGDEINIVENGTLKSVKVHSVEHKMMKGKYDLFTEEGSVIVDNIACTIFDGPLPHKLALWGWRVANKFKWFYNLNYLWYKPLYKLTTSEPK
jgi:ribosomal 50S subunit-recycling heat shock protein